MSKITKITVKYIDSPAEPIEYYLGPTIDDGPVNDWDPDAIDQRERFEALEDSFDDHN